MKFDQKIASLLESGKISLEQAQTLRRSLAGEAIKADVVFHDKIPSRLIAGVGGAFIFVLLGLIISGQGSSDPQVIQDVSKTINEVGKVGEMNKSMTVILSLVLFGLPIIGSLLLFAFTYNGLVAKEEGVLSAWAQVESNYQRRADLIPNLVKTVKGFAEHEREVLTDVTKLRENIDALERDNRKAAEMTQGAATKLDDEDYMASLSGLHQKLGSDIQQTLLMVESYPNLKSSEQFLELQGQLEGTENRINVARMAFNEQVGIYNAAIRKMPGSLVAGLGSFQRKAYFKSDDGADKVQDVDFSDHE